MSCIDVLIHLLKWLQVTLVELSRPSPTVSEILTGIGSSIVGVERTLKELLQDLTFSNGVQARMNGIFVDHIF